MLTSSGFKGVLAKFQTSNARRKRRAFPCLSASKQFFDPWLKKKTRPRILLSRQGNDRIPAPSWILHRRKGLALEWNGCISTFRNARNDLVFVQTKERAA